MIKLLCYLLGHSFQHMVGQVCVDNRTIPKVVHVCSRCGKIEWNNK